jgi:hypothetical protein
LGAQPSCPIRTEKASRSYFCVDGVGRLEKAQYLVGLEMSPRRAAVLPQAQPSATLDGIALDYVVLALDGSAENLPE